MSEYTRLQSQFFFNLCRFGLWLEAQGYDVGMGEAWRTPEQAALNAAKGLGIAASLHIDRMASDLIIRKDGTGVGPEDYKRCGAAWKALHELNRWGGDFTGKSAGDFQHFSQEFQNRK
jgi:hypothetical protein